MLRHVLRASTVVVVALFTGFTEYAVADIPAGGIGKVEIRNASAAVSAAVSEALVSELKNSGKYNSQSPNVMTVSLDGYFVRVGNTPAQLRQQGGRDVARGVVTLSGGGASEETRPFIVRMRGDGFENISQVRRAQNLHNSIAQVAANSVR